MGLRAQVPHRGAAANDALELIALLQLRSQVRVFRPQASLLERLLQHVQQLVELKRLRDEVGSAPLDRIDGILHGSVAGNDDRHNPWIPFARRVDDLGPVNAREPEVGDDDVKGKLIEQLQCLLATGRFDDLEAALEQALGHHRAQSGFIVDKEQMSSFSHVCQYFDSAAAKQQKQGIRIRRMRPIRVCVTG